METMKIDDFMIDAKRVMSIVLRSSMYYVYYA